MSTWEAVSKLFTETDIAHMKPKGVDLSSCQNVADEADDILDRVTRADDAPGAMPPPYTQPHEDMWGEEQLSVFNAWVAAGKVCD